MRFNKTKFIFLGIIIISLFFSFGYFKNNEAIGRNKDSGTGHCVDFCGNDNGVPKHVYACCDGDWWYNACAWISGCSTGWKNVSVELLKCCDECASTNKCLFSGKCQGEECFPNKSPTGNVET